MPSCRRLTTCRMGFAGATPTLEMHLRSRRGVGVRYWAQANARGSSGVRGMAQTRKCRVWCGRAPAGPSRAHCGPDSCKAPCDRTLYRFGR